MKSEKRKNKIIRILAGLKTEGFFITENGDGSKIVIEKGVGVVEFWSKQYYENVISKIEVPKDYKQEIEQRKLELVPFEKLLYKGNEVIFIDWTEKNELIVILESESIKISQNEIEKIK
jgi:hypothetical protein